MKESETSTSNKVERLCANIGERFIDYLLIVRDHDNVVWRASDRTWAIGACDRYVDAALEDDRMGTEEHKDG